MPVRLIAWRPDGRLGQGIGGIIRQLSGSSPARRCEMSRIYTLSCCCVLALVLSGCGPLRAPLPVRLDDEQQKSINESWDKALSPVDRFNSQSLLDILLATGAYQNGVDKLEFRSEKNFAGGLVVMEVRFEQSAPERDQFTVTVQDRQGKTLR